MTSNVTNRDHLQAIVRKDLNPFQNTLISSSVVDFNSVINGVKMPEVNLTAEIRLKAHQLLREFMTGSWKNISQDELILRQVSGGLSNLLYYCSLPSNVTPVGQEPSQVLLRIYGSSQEGNDSVFEAHFTECIIFAMLSESQKGPRLYGIFKGGRLEQYIPGRPLATDELCNPTFSILIAELMAQIHLMEVPLCKEPRWLWDTLSRWLVTIEEAILLGRFTNNKQKMVHSILEYGLHKETKFLKKVIEEINSPVLFCHNDIQEGNILLKGEELGDDHGSGTNAKMTTWRKLTIIDYEYCSYNYRGFDLANHFCETMYDYSNEDFPYFWAKPENYPSKQMQESFIRKYLQCLHQTETIDELEVESVMKEVRIFTLASHFFWGVWSVVNASTSTVTFDYWGYGEARFNAYYDQKSELIKSKEITIDVGGDTEKKNSSLKSPVKF